MIKRLFPDGKSKVFTLSYDDGVIQDIRLVELINKYNLKATFNLNSYLSETEFEWIHPTGAVIKRLPCKRLSELYRGHEVASHTRSHPYMENLTEAQIMDEMAMDKEALENICNTKVCGFAVPFDFYSETIETCAVKCGFEYARTSQESGNFIPQKSYHSWQPTVFHLDSKLESLVNDFILWEQELGVFQLVGHSYDLDTENMWEKTEEIFKLISKQKSILPMTHLQLVRYLKAMDTAIITTDTITNLSDISLWFSIDGNIVEINGSDTIKTIKYL